MIKQEGTVTSFKELGETFLDFVQQSNDTTEPWEVIDDRLDEFYGATIRFPVTNSNFDIDMFADVSKLDLGNIDAVDVIEMSVVPKYDGNHWHYAREVRYGSPRCHDYFKLIARCLGMSNSVLSLRNHYSFEVTDDIADMHIVSHNTYTPSSVVIACISFDPSIYLMEEESVIISYYEAQYECLAKYINDNGLSTKILPVVILFHNLYLGLDNANQYTGTYWKYYKVYDDMLPIIDDYKNRLLSLSFPFYLLDFQRGGENVRFDVSRNSGGYGTSYTWGLHKKYTIYSISGKYSISGGPYVWSNDISYPELSSIYQALTDVGEYQFTGTSQEISVLCHMSGDNLSNWDVCGVPISQYYFGDIGSEYVTNFPSYITDIKTTLSNYQETLYAYISLQYNKITSTTYNEWLTNTKDNYMSESFDSRRRIPAFYNNAETWRTVTISNQYQNDVPNIFKDTGEVLFISPHIKYDKNLWMCEQGGIACDQETRTQNIEDNAIRHRKLTSNFGGYATQTFVKVPPFPSLGCPMFTINDELLSQEIINYYFIRDNNSASIVIYVPTTDSMTYSYAVQHMSFGVLDCFSISEQFMYPLYVAGGNGGLYQEHWSYYNPWGGAPNHEVGNIYKLDMENISLSNSNLLLSAKFNGANVSNFRVLCPDGHWDNIFNVTQNASLITQSACYTDAWTPRYYLLNKPQVGGSELGDSRYGGTTTLNGDDSIKRIDTGYIKPDYKATQTVQYSKTFHANAPIQPVMPVFSSHKIVSSELWPRHRYGVIGKIPRCYSTWSRHLKFGELEIGGKKFLSIPNAYDARTWYIPYFTSFQDLSTVESAYRQNANANSVFNNNYIYDYLLLKLED